MTTHELAKKLLEMPDIPVVAEDGLDPSEPCEITGVEECREDDSFRGKECFWKYDKHARVTTY